MIALSQTRPEAAVPTPLPVQSDLGKLGGTVCIADTRMPMANLLVHLSQGGSVASFHEKHPWITEKELTSALAYAGMELMDSAPVRELLRNASLASWHEMSNAERHGLEGAA